MIRLKETTVNWCQEKSLGKSFAQFCWFFNQIYEKFVVTKTFGTIHKLSVELWNPLMKKKTYYWLLTTFGGIFYVYLIDFSEG